MAVANTPWLARRVAAARRVCGARSASLGCGAGSTARLLLLLRVIGDTMAVRTRQRGQFSIDSNGAWIFS
jgi:hypothetical protein